MPRLLIETGRDPSLRGGFSKPRAGIGARGTVLRRSGPQRVEERGKDEASVLQCHPWFVHSIAFTQPVLAQQPAAHSAPREDSTYIDGEGTAYITRIVSVPQTISPEAQKSFARQATPAASHDAPSQPTKPKRSKPSRCRLTLLGRCIRRISNSPLSRGSRQRRYAARIPANKANRVLINLHGGGFTSDSGSLTESLPIANLTQTKVVSVIYRLAPEHTFPPRSRMSWRFTKS